MRYATISITIIFLKRFENHKIHNLMNTQFYDGYQTSFLGPEVAFPDLAAYKDSIATVVGSTEKIVQYVNYSLAISSERRFPIFTASNIDAGQFQKASRKDNWRNDDRISDEHQWGKDLYKAVKSDFDRGHMTKREDVQWGPSMAFASLAADSTFFYTNAVPQHADLNQKIWRSLEDYILHKESVENKLKIIVFTGPVLHKNDPEFITKVNGQSIKLPVLFWKMVYYLKADGLLYRVAFLMSQNSLLKNGGITATGLELENFDRDDLFMKFEEADTYQVNVATVESLTSLKFAEAIEPFHDDRAVKLIMEEIDVRESFLETASVEGLLGFSLKNISL